MKEKITSQKEKRKEEEKDLEKQQVDIPFPGWESLDTERNQDKPLLLFTIKDDQGNIVNRITSPPKKGINRVSWDLRHAAKNPIGLNSPPEITTSSGFLVTPGTYSVTLSSLSNGKEVQLAEEKRFEVKPLRKGTLKGSTYKEINQYRNEIEALEQEVGSVRSLLNKGKLTIQAMKKAYLRIDGEVPELRNRIYETELTLQKLDGQLNGSSTKGEVGEKDIASPASRLSVANNGLRTTYGPTALHRQSLELGQAQIKPIKSGVREVMEVILPQLEKDLLKAGAPWIEGGPFMNTDGS